MNLLCTTFVSTSSLLLAGTMAACSTPAPTQPRTISVSAGGCSQPPYPDELRRSAVSGTTTLEFEVNAAGRVTRVAIIGSSGQSPGHKILDGLALDTVNKCAFPPAPGFLPSTSRIAYVWRLQE